jgi:hypothetical protein
VPQSVVPVAEKKPAAVTHGKKMAVKSSNALMIKVGI